MPIKEQIGGKKVVSALNWEVLYKPYDISTANENLVIQDILPEGLDLPLDSNGELLFEDAKGLKKFITAKEMQLQADGSYIDGADVPDLEE